MKRNTAGRKWEKGWLIYMRSYNIQSKYFRQEAKDAEMSSGFTKYILTAMALSCTIIAGLYYQPVMYIAAVGWALFLFFIPTGYSIMALLYLISFEYVFRLTATSGSLFTYLQIIPIIKIIFFDKAFSIDKKCLLPYVLLLVYVCVLSFTDIQSIFRIALGFFVLICVFQNETGNRINCKQLFIFYSVGIIMSAILAKTNPRVVAPFVKNVVVRLSDGSALDRFTGLYNNPNYFSIEVSLALAGNLVLFMNGEEKWYELLPIGGALCWLGIISQSKTFVITLAFMLVFTVVYYGRHKPVYLLGFILLFIGVALCFRAEVQRLVEKYFYRFILLNEDEASIDEVTTGRAEIWKMYISIFLNDFRILFLGNGIGNWIMYDPHNMFIEFVYCIGIIGSVIYFITVWGIQSRIIRRRNYLLFLAVLLIRGFAANIAFYINTYYYYLLLFALMGSGISADAGIETERKNSDGDCLLLRSNTSHMSYVK